MRHLLKIEHVVKRKSGIIIFDKTKIVDAILKAIGVETYRTYDVSNISQKLSLTTSDLISIFTHARIEVIDNCVPEEGIKFLVDREIGKIKRYFERSLANYTSLSLKEQRIFDAFLKKYSIKYRKIKKWDDLRIEAIRRDYYDEITGHKDQTFYDGQFICYIELETSDESKSNSIVQLIRSSLMYNIKNKRQWIQFKPSSNTTVAFILTHHFHIYTSDDSNSIHAAKQNTMFNLPSNARIIL